MNIDLLKTKTNDYGLVCDAPLPAMPQAAIFDSKQGIMSIEFGSEFDALVCNVSVAHEWRLSLSLATSVLIGCIDNGTLIYAERIQLSSIL